MSNAAEDAGAKAKHWFDRAIFPISAGAVVAEIGHVRVAVLKLGTQLGSWAGAVGAVVAVVIFALQTMPRKQ